MEAFWNFAYQRRYEIFSQTLQHLYLTTIALLLAVALGLVIGVLLSRYRRWSAGVLGLLGVIQTIPSLALLGFMLPLLGIGALPAIIALFLYALLPIVRNTFTGIVEVEPSVIEAARGMGMSYRQVLQQVEIPLALPIIFAGIRTAVVINVGIATLCALIAAGGLGEFIFRGIALNNAHMTLAGAIPAALLALALDSLLGLMQRFIYQLWRPLLGLSVLGLLVFFGQLARGYLTERQTLVAGFDAEFKERADGYPNLQKVYGLQFDKTRDLDAGLMYLALRNGQVDVISGYATEGKIDAFRLKVLKDDRKCFPPYEVAPVVNARVLQKYPYLEGVLQKLVGKISDVQMRRLNYEVDENQRPTREVARAFLQSLGLKTETIRTGKPDILIGGKKFTEQYILLEIFKLLIENYSPLTVQIKAGLGGTQICHEAVRKGEIALYPEYTGTALLVILKPEARVLTKLGSEKAVYEFVKKESARQYGLTWLKPLGFNNTYALMMRQAQAEKHQIETISDLRAFIENMK
ncbi:MAG: hypothetical protein OHK0053_27060 [Microscillaceae bacterium]